MTHQRRILHCLRAPVGGLFRHVRDLVKAQANAGHSVGIICDSGSGGASARQALAGLDPYCALGIGRIAMSRHIGLRDISATRAVRRLAIEANAQILHGHGAKGGAYARLAAAVMKKGGHKIFACYTPHGGSLHYDRASIAGCIFHTLEKLLAPLTDILVFESQYSAGLYEIKVAPFPCEVAVAPNGLWPEEFKAVKPSRDAADFLFVGELRHLKGVDILLNALAGMRQKEKATARIVGSGPDEAEFQRMAQQLQLGASVTFTGAMPAREAFALGRCIVLPSRAESFPYIVLEAAAARIPMILTHVGGIPEIVAKTGMDLVPPGDTAALIVQMENFLDDPAGYADRAGILQKTVSERYQAPQMAKTILDSYERLFERTTSANERS